MGCGVGVGYSTGPSYFMGVKGSVVYSWSGPFIFSIQSPFFQFHFIFLCSDINPSTLLFFLQTISLSSLSLSISPTETGVGISAGKLHQFPIGDYECLAVEKIINNLARGERDTTGGFNVQCRKNTYTTGERRRRG